MSCFMKLALSRIKYNKSRTCIMVIAILLSSCLLTMVSTIGIGIIDINKKVIAQSNNNYHMKLTNISLQQIEELKKNEAVESILVSKVIAKIDNENTEAYLVYNNNIKEGISNVECKIGTMPKEKNEIAASEAFFQQFNVEPKVGEQIELPIRIDNKGYIIQKTFEISGILNEANLALSSIDTKKVTYSAFVSEAFLQQYTDKIDNEYTVLVRLYGENRLSYSKLIDKMNILNNELGINEEQVRINTYYLKIMTNPSIQMWLFIIFIILVVLFLATTVLYGVSCVSVSQDVQEIGRLTVLGTSKLEIRRLLYLEGAIYLLIGLPSGIVLGEIFSLFSLRYICTTYTNVTFNASIISPINIIIVLCAVTVSMLIAIKRPISLASSISPIEASKYNDEQDSNATRKKKYNEMNLKRLIFVYLYGSNKKTKTIIFTLSFCCTLFIAIAALLRSVNEELYARQTIPEGDFRIELKYDTDDAEYQENNLNYIQKENIFSDDIKNQINNLDGVEQIKEVYLAIANMNYAESNVTPGTVETIGVFEEDDVQQLNKYLKRGTIDYNNMVSNNGIIYTYDNGFDKNGYGIGDEFILEMLNGNEKYDTRVKLMASTQSMSYGTFLMTKDTFEKVYSNQPPVYAITIFAHKEKYNEVKEQLQIIFENASKVEMYSIDEEMDYSKKIVSIIKYPIYVVILMIAGISLLNYINTSLANIAARKRDIAILRCLGLSKLQKFVLLLGEGVVITLCVEAIGGTVGTLLGYILFLYAKSNSWIGIDTYHIPVGEITLTFVALIVFHFIITSILSFQTERTSVMGILRRN